MSSMLHLSSRRHFEGDLGCSEGGGSSLEVLGQTVGAGGSY